MRNIINRVGLSWQLGLVAVCLLLLSCSPPVSNSSPSDTSAVASSPGDTAPNSEVMLDPPVPSPENVETLEVFGPGQLLPITAEADLAGTTIQLEVAETRQQQSLGLMYRTQLADDRGMLFPFDVPRQASFWMMNVPISLDMVFLLEGRVQAIAENVPPCEAQPCPTYGPGSLLVDQVIELRGGRAAELGLATGDEVTIRRLEP